MSDSHARRPSLFYLFSRLLVRLLVALLSRCTVTGLENVPRSGPLLIVSNHLNNADPVIIAAFVPRNVTFMVKEALFRWPVLPLTLWYGGIRVRRGEADREAIRAALSLLDGGQVVGVFPEGTRSRSGRLGPGRPGAGLLALRTNAAILPIGIVGTQDVLGLAPIVRRPRISVRIGRPFHVEPHVGGGRSAAAMQATETIMGRVAELLPPEMAPAPPPAGETARSVRSSKS
ncbi:MAG: 1-acyl-sn-glycerol-3-phosphate acyltransferase [Chloroflexi bacterium]|nr:1-acyl-sn-glycerol-3-phosphate acyltransferase [Chloroflexota bacterium]